jgi:tetratricopeptide (TPR) repeat protein
VVLETAQAIPLNLSHGIEKFQAAYQAWDADGFGNAAEDFRKAVKSDPQSSICQYWLGVSHFHSMLQLRSLNDASQEAAALSQMTAAENALEAAVAINPNDAESHALLATLSGMRIDGNFIRALRYGPSIQQHQKHALASGAKNPRVQYLLGVALLKTADDNNDRNEALKALLLAESLFDAESKAGAGPDQPTWGRDACLTFIGQAHAELGNRDDAIAYYKKALLARSNNPPAKAGLAKLQH